MSLLSRLRTLWRSDRSVDDGSMEFRAHDQASASTRMRRPDRLSGLRCVSPLSTESDGGELKFLRDDRRHSALVAFDRECTRSDRSDRPRMSVRKVQWRTPLGSYISPYANRLAVVRYFAYA